MRVVDAVLVRFRSRRASAASGVPLTSQLDATITSAVAEMGSFMNDAG